MLLTPSFFFSGGEKKKKKKEIEQVETREPSLQVIHLIYFIHFGHGVECLLLQMDYTGLISNSLSDNHKELL